MAEEEIEEENGSTTTTSLLATVARCNLPPRFLDSASPQAIEEALKRLSHVRLDREHIGSLHSPFLTYFPNLKNLYLQENDLRSLDGIEAAKDLTFLSVSGNKLTNVHGIKVLHKLNFLDISHNAVSHIDAETELPKSLKFLVVNNNPCCTLQTDLESHLVLALPELKEIYIDPKRCKDFNFLVDGNKTTSCCDNFMEAMEVRLQMLDNNTPEKEKNRRTLRNRNGNGSTREFLDTSTRQALCDANSSLSPIIQDTSDQLRRSFDSIVDRSRLRALEDNKEKKFRKPSFKRMQKGLSFEPIQLGEDL